MGLWKVETDLILLQKNEIVKIQSLLRASKARDDYKTLGKWQYSETKCGPLINQARTNYSHFSYFRDCSRNRIDFNHLRLQVLNWYTEEHVMIGKGLSCYKWKAKWSGYNFFQKNGVGINANVFILNLSYNQNLMQKELARR